MTVFNFFTRSAPSATFDKISPWYHGVEPHYQQGQGMKKERIIVLTAVLMILVGLGFLLLRKGASPERVEKLRIGVFADSICALVYVAQQQGFFKRHGVDLTIENYQTGSYAVNDLVAGKVDVATASEFALVLQGFKTGDLRAVGTISTADNVEVVARRDRGIEKPADLRGKRVGVPRNTGADFFLRTFLSFSGIRPEEIRAVDLKPSEMVEALSEGKIDAVCWIPPFSDAVKKNLGGKVLSWSAQGGLDYFFLMITRDELIKARPRTVTGLLKGVLEAEDFLRMHEKEAQSIIERNLGLDHEAVLNTWAKTHFRVRLDQALLTLMEDEARWAIRNKLVDSEKVPNYLTFLYLEGLEKIRPNAVSVIH